MIAIIIRLVNSTQFEHSILTLYNKLLAYTIATIVLVLDSQVKLYMPFTKLLLSHVSTLCFFLLRFLGVCVIVIYFSVIYGAYVPDWEFTVHNIDSQDNRKVFKVINTFNQT